MEGFLFRYPGFPSLAVPYHDTNDFFYSGHVGACFLLVLEMRSKRFYKMSWFFLTIMISQWFMMMCLRTHYCIDMVTAMICAHYFHRHAERMTYFVDCKCIGLPVHKREYYYFKQCNNCGWSNQHAINYLAEEEREVLKSIYPRSVKV
jgi:hypothetical protein